MSRHFHAIKTQDFLPTFMKKSIYCLITASALLVTLCSCSVLPKPDDTSPTPSSTTEPAVSTSDANGATQSEVQEISAGTSDLYDKLKATYDAEKATKLLIKTVRLQTQVDTLMQMQPMMTAEEKAKAEIETAKQTPYTEVSADLTSYCHKQTEYAMQEFSTIIQVRLTKRTKIIALYTKFIVAKMKWKSMVVLHLKG